MIMNNVFDKLNGCGMHSVSILDTYTMSIKHITYIDTSKYVDVATIDMYDNHGKLVPKSDNKYDLRDYSSTDLLQMIEIGIRDEKHIGDKVIILPVGWILISTEEYNKRMQPSWWIGTPYELPIIISKGLAVFVLMLTIPYVALTRMENMPDEWRITAKDTQSSTSGG